MSLQERVEVVKYAGENLRAGSRKIAEVFGCGRTQIQAILKNKETILKEYEANPQASRKQLGPPRLHPPSAALATNEAKEGQGIVRWWMVQPGTFHN